MQSPSGKLIVFTWILCPLTARADSDTSDLIDLLAEKVEQMYVDADKAKDTAGHIRRRSQTGVYKGKANKDLAHALTADLRERSNDNHFQVRCSAEQFRSLTGEKESILPRATLLREAREKNFGFTQLKILEGNVGYLKLDSFSWQDGAEDKARAMLAGIADAYAVIIDLRDNRGGDSTMTQFLMGYFFDGDAGKPLQVFTKRYTDWTYEMMPKAVSGRRMIDTPLFVLTSARTWSAGEELAYLLQARHRATVIGEKTGGGANGIEFVPLADNFVLKIPSIRSIDTVTGTNWEGVGVRPDHPCDSEDALDHAHRLALEAVVAKAPPDQKGRLGLIRDKIAAVSNAAGTDASRLQRFEGNYGGNTLKYKDGAFWFLPRGRQDDWRKLTPLGNDTFMIEGMNDSKFSLALENGKAIATVTFADGRTMMVPRNE